MAYTRQQHTFEQEMNKEAPQYLSPRMLDLHHNFIPIPQQRQSVVTPPQEQQMYPFTQSQWAELEHQALIFKYMMARAPIPPELIVPLRRGLLNNSWGGFQLGVCSSSPLDAEPGRCRRTDGKKWRCSKPVVPDQKYCERHMHRGRNRSKKNQASAPANTKSVPTPLPQQQLTPSLDHERELFTRERKTPDALRHFFDDWPREPKEDSQYDDTSRRNCVFKLSLDEHTQEERSKEDPYTNIGLTPTRTPWFRDAPHAPGGPLAEALQHRPVGLAFMDTQACRKQQQQQTSSIVTSPTGVLQKISCFSDCSSSASSPGSIRTDNVPHSLAQLE